MKKSYLKLASKPNNFKSDSIKSLLRAQSELKKILIKARNSNTQKPDNKISNIHNLKHKDELGSWDKILGFKAIELGYKIELYEYHHDEIGEILDVKKFYDQFLGEHEELMNEFFLWAEMGGDK